MKAVTSSTREVVFSVGSVQSVYQEKGVKEFVQGSYESVVSWRGVSRRIFNSEVPE
jgi:hypothetical protein